MRVPDDWFVGFHTGLVARFWQAAAATMADGDAATVRALLPDGGRVLDVPCGDGRLSARLAEAGYDVTGVDISPEAIAMARATTTRARFEVGDLRALPDGPFDGVVSWGNSFGYLTPAETPRSLAEFRRVLRPGGTLVLESLTVAESLLPGGIGPGSTYEFGGVTMTTTNRYRAAESRLEQDYVFEGPDGAREHSQAAHHVHTAGEVVRMLRAAGFDDVTLLNGDREAFALGDGRLIAVAT